MKITTIEDMFEIPKRGLFIVPDIPRQSIPYPPPVFVILVSKDGLKRRVEAEFVLPHFDPSVREIGYLCVLKNTSKAEVEIGTEVWIDEDES